MRRFLSRSFRFSREEGRIQDVEREPPKPPGNEMSGDRTTIQFVPPGHFYSPVPDSEDAERAMRHAAAAEGVRLPGIEIDDAAMVSLWHKLSPAFARMPFEDDPQPDLRYFYRNDMYSYGDAAVYFGMVDYLKPKRIVEIGSGYSSALALDMREILGLGIDLTFIEPYPGTLNTLLTDGDRQNVTLIADKVQNADLDVFDRLEKNDILFVDSSHVVKAGSDVCFEMFDILPRLKPGVVVHFHDCFWPFEYPRNWVVDDNRAWNELYMLRAFLMYNTDFEIVFFNSYFAKRFADEVKRFPTHFPKNPGGGLWLRRR